jgi:hypothetical protein
MPRQLPAPLLRSSTATGTASKRSKTYLSFDSCTLHLFVPLLPAAHFETNSAWSVCVISMFFRKNVRKQRQTVTSDGELCFCCERSKIWKCTSRLDSKVRQLTSLPKYLIYHIALTSSTMMFCRWQPSSYTATAATKTFLFSLLLTKSLLILHSFAIIVNSFSFSSLPPSYSSTLYNNQQHTQYIIQRRGCSSSAVISSSSSSSFDVSNNYSALMHKSRFGTLRPLFAVITSFKIIGTQPRYFGCHFGNTPIYRTRASREAAINSCSRHVDVAL